MSPALEVLHDWPRGVEITMDLEMGLVQETSPSWTEA